MKSFNVIWQNINSQKFEPYNVMPYLVEQYNKAKDKPTTFEEFKEFITKESAYMYWSRCEYEIIICGWPNKNLEDKWDIHGQILMNLDVITNILMENVRQS